MKQFKWNIRCTGRLLAVLLAAALAFSHGSPAQLQAAEQRYQVQTGDSWWRVSQRFGIDYNILAAYNGRTAADTLYTGEFLLIPGQETADRTYTVQSGDSWWLIGRRFGVDFNTLAAYNGRSIGSTLRVGEVLRIPSGSTVTAPPAGSGITVQATQARPVASSAPQTGIYDQPGTYVTLAPIRQAKPLDPGAYVYIQTIERSGNNIYGIAHTGARFPIYVNGIAFMEKRPDPGYQAIPSVPAGDYTVTQLPSTIWNGIGMGYIIRTPGGKTVVIDGGMQSYNPPATGTVSGYGSGEEANLLGFLQKNTGGYVDYWIWTHLHNDHINASAALINKGSVHVGKLAASSYKSLIYPDQSAADKTYAEGARTRMQQAGRYMELDTGSVITIDGLRIEVLKGKYANWNENDQSLVMKLTFGQTGRTMLVTGDASANITDLMIRQYGSALKADILQMSHHGLYDMTEFYSYVKPRYLLVPASTQALMMHPQIMDHAAKLKAFSDVQAYLSHDRWVTLTIR